MGCSEIIVSVIVKHLQHVEINRLFIYLGDLLSFSMPGGQKKWLGCGLWFAKGAQYAVCHYVLKSSSMFKFEQILCALQKLSFC